MICASLANGEVIKGWSILHRLTVNASESEVYVCEKDGGKYIFKYYINAHTDIKITKILLRCKNNNIVRFVDFGDYNNRYFEILEYMQGGSLGDKDSNNNYKYLPVSVAKVYNIIAQINDGLKALHNLGIVHRDIKPENILCSLDFKRFCMSDFGVSSIIEYPHCLSPIKTMARTEGYVGPEVYLHTAGPKTDYYSLGISVWRLLTGVDPFIYKNQEKMSDEAIHRFTVNGKIGYMLLERSSLLDKELKNLIYHLLIADYNKRWGYDNVCDFLQSRRSL